MPGGELCFIVPNFLISSPLFKYAKPSDNPLVVFLQYADLLITNVHLPHLTSDDGPGLFWDAMDEVRRGISWLKQNSDVEIHDLVVAGDFNEYLPANISAISGPGVLKTGLRRRGGQGDMVNETVRDAPHWAQRAARQEALRGLLDNTSPSLICRPLQGPSGCEVYASSEQQSILPILRA